MSEPWTGRFFLFEVTQEPERRSDYFSARRHRSAQGLLLSREVERLHRSLVSSEPSRECALGRWTEAEGQDYFLLLRFRIARGTGRAARPWLEARGVALSSSDLAACRCAPVDLFFDRAVWSRFEDSADSEFVGGIARAVRPEASHPWAPAIAPSLRRSSASTGPRTFECEDLEDGMNALRSAQALRPEPARSDSRWSFAVGVPHRFFERESFDVVLECRSRADEVAARDHREQTPAPEGPYDEAPSLEEAPGPRRRLPALPSLRGTLVALRQALLVLILAGMAFLYGMLWPTEDLNQLKLCLARAEPVVVGGRKAEAPPPVAASPAPGAAPSPAVGSTQSPDLSKILEQVRRFWPSRPPQSQKSTEKPSTTSPSKPPDTGGGGRGGAPKPNAGASGQGAPH